MIVVLQTHSLSLAESARVALAAEHIDAVMLDEFSPGTLGLAGSLRVAIVNDADEPMAARIVARLQPPTGKSLPSWWWHKRAFLALSSAIVLSFAGMSINGSASMRVLSLTLSSAGALLFVGAVVLLFLGYRADRRP